MVQCLLITSCNGHNRGASTKSNFEFNSLEKLHGAATRFRKFHFVTRLLLFSLSSQHYKILHRKTFRKMVSCFQINNTFEKVIWLYFEFTGTFLEK